MIEVYDLESLSNLFTYTGYDYKNDQWYQYVICAWRNDFVEMMHHLETLKIMIGYNNEAYDYPIIHHCIRHCEEYQYLDGQTIAQKLFQKSQEIINQKFTVIADKNKYIKQIDLYALMGYDNAAQRTSCLRSINQFNCWNILKLIYLCKGEETQKQIMRLSKV